MNIKHVKSNVWSKLALASYAGSMAVGVFGRSRTKFSNDFSYNVNLGRANLLVEIPLWRLYESHLWYRDVAIR